MRCGALRRTGGPTGRSGCGARRRSSWPISAAGYLFDFIAARDLIWLIVAAMALCVAAAWTLPPLGARPAGRSGETPRRPRVLLRDPSFLAVAAAASLIQGSHALYYGFSTIDWQAAGYGGGTIGVLWALGVLAEIVLFALSARLPAAFTPDRADPDRSRRRAGALDRDGARPARRAARRCCNACTGCRSARRISARSLHWARRAGRARGDRARLSRGRRPALRWRRRTGLSGLLYGRFGAAAYGAMALIAAAGLAAALVAHRLQERRTVAKGVSWQVRYIDASSRPLRYFICAREAAAPGDPALHVRRIDRHQQLRAAAVGDGPAVLAVMPGGMKAEPRAPRHADALTRDDAEHQRAGRKARPVDDHLLTRIRGSP